MNALEFGPSPVESHGLTRRKFIEGALATAGLVAVGGALEYRALTNEPAQVTPLDPSLFGYYGMLAGQILHDAYRVKDHSKKGMYCSYFPNTSETATNWAFSQVVAANLDASGNKDASERLQNNLLESIGGLARYEYIDPATGYSGYRGEVTSSDTFFDDMGWVGLNYVRAARSMKNEQMIRRGESTYSFIIMGKTDANKCADPTIPWSTKSGNNQYDVNTVSNAPNAQLGMRLYKLDSSPDPYYLKEAERIATASLTHFSKDGVPDITKQPIEFNSVYLRNLLLLSSQTHDVNLRGLITSTAYDYAQYVWPKFFVHNKNITWFDSYPLLKQAPIVQIINMLGWEPEQYDLLV